MSIRKTLLVVLDNLNIDSLTYSVVHKSNISVKHAFQEAFERFAKTSYGKRFKKMYGSDWKNVHSIPFDHLERAGILSITPITEQSKVVVNYNESMYL